MWRFLCTFAQKEFFSDRPKGIECIWELCACSRERQLAFLSFLGPEGRPQNGGFLHLIDKIADFLHNKTVFSDSPEDLHYYWASAQPCADRLRR